MASITSDVSLWYRTCNKNLLNYEQIPFDIKNINSLVDFKKEIRKLKPANCPVRICKVYISNLCFI